MGAGVERRLLSGNWIDVTHDLKLHGLFNWSMQLYNGHNIFQ